MSKKLTAETLPYDAKAAAGNAATEVINQAAFIGVGLLGMCRHNPKNGIEALHDWIAAESLYGSAYNSLLRQCGEPFAKTVADRIRRQLHENGYMVAYDCYGEMFPMVGKW